MEARGVGFSAVAGADPVGGTVAEAPPGGQPDQLSSARLAETRDDGSPEPPPPALEDLPAKRGCPASPAEPRSFSDPPPPDAPLELPGASRIRAPKTGRRRGVRGRRGSQRGGMRAKSGRPPAPLGVSSLPLPDDPSGTPPVRVPKKRGRKSKAELLLMKLSQGLEQPEPPPPSSGPEDPETPAGTRPRRRAARVALLYLQELAEELTSALPPHASYPESSELSDHPKRGRGRGRRGEEEEEEEEEDDTTRDADFVVQAEAEDGEESEPLSEGSSDSEPAAFRGGGVRSSSSGKPRLQCRGIAPNGLPNYIMAPVWKSLNLTKNLREQLHSHWEFPEWIPSASKWHLLTDTEAAPYLPRELKSPLFSVQREGLPEDEALYRINRFGSLTPHGERWDVSFFTGGPLWALEWCPVPEGASALQYVALFCSPDMDETHAISRPHGGPGLLQLWGLGALQQDSCTGSKAYLAYGIACDHGCIWDLKFCPSGAWELPTTSRKAPLLPRLGLLALACSDGKVLLLSLPHPEALLARRPPDASKHAIYKVQCVAHLQVGSVQAGGPSECGQCFSLAWMPSQPHQHLAAGFYDGTVAIWNLPTTSLLQRVRLPDGSLKLYPFRCLPAHDQAVRCLQWCKANSNFLVSAGSDRKIKFWDLRRPYEPVNSIKRFLSTELSWLLPYSGVTVAQDNCYASYGLCGIHYIDAGFLGFKAYFTAPRKGTVWSLSGSDWLGAVAAGDMSGELIAAVLPDMAVNPLNIKRPAERRFPVYKADLLPCGGCPGDQAPPDNPGPSRARTYAEATTQHYLLFRDTDLREPMLRMQEGEGHSQLCLDRLQLEAVHKVRFSPNLASHCWLVSGGQSGLVRAHCIRGLTCSLGRRLQLESQAHFSAMFPSSSSSSPEGPNVPATVHRLLPNP
ncbi:general transcription factor 3C polypeptide 2 isoform X2 [Ornithorhynchus anatinus]|uniref:general transcription factor 3C polypeptide 2 isoform X2 n=1 Tax=Ornithorhynchus anatinus TaxID=9258 RepID=UPI0010A9211D|nr:general transcription factor 3C polypeptide 2 isoform X2 [Ornithorhynchus anatinus]